MIGNEHVTVYGFTYIYMNCNIMDMDHVMDNVWNCMDMNHVMDNV